METDAQLKKCFEKDWSLGKYLNFISDDEDREKTKEFLHSHYKIMKECYKHHSTFTSFERMYCIGNFYIIKFEFIFD